MGIPLDPKEPNLIQRNSQDLQTAHDGPRVQSWDAFPLAARAGRIFFGKASKRAIGGGGGRRANDCSCLAVATLRRGGGW